MDDGGRWILFLLLIVMSFLYHSGLVALLGANELRLQRLGEMYPERMPHIQRILAIPLPKQQSRMYVSYIMAQSAGAALGMSLASPRLWWVSVNLFGEQSFLAPAAFLVLRLIMFAVLIMMISAVCHVLPTRLFGHEPEMFLLRWHRVLHIISLPLYPIAVCSLALGQWIAGLLGHGAGTEQDNVTEEEIRDLVDVSEENGDIEKQEREMIHNIFDFDDMDVAEVMTHRTDIVGIALDATVQDAVNCAFHQGFSRIPVYENDLDNIKGMLFVKDFLCLVGSHISEQMKITDFIRQAIFVPQAQKCTDLFKIFKLQKIHIAVVVDDYGGTAGIVSMEDLLEAIVGNIQDEYDDDNEQIVKLEEQTYLLDGAMDIGDVEQLFGVHFQLDEAAHTLGGMITNTLGRIPADEEMLEVTIKNIQFSVVVAKNNRIERVKATLLSAPSQQA